MKLNSYKELIVWQKSISLVELVYELTSRFPEQEKFGIVAQLRRAAISIPSNIAEGYGRRSHKEYLQFYSISFGSALEVETQLIIAQKLGYLSISGYEKVQSILSEVTRMLYVMVYRPREQKGEATIR